MRGTPPHGRSWRSVLRKACLLLVLWTLPAALVWGDRLPSPPLEAMLSGLEGIWVRDDLAGDGRDLEEAPMGEMPRGVLVGSRLRLTWDPALAGRARGRAVCVPHGIDTLTERKIEAWTLAERSEGELYWAPRFQSATATYRLVALSAEHLTLQTIDSTVDSPRAPRAWPTRATYHRRNVNQIDVGPTTPRFASTVKANP